MSPKLLFLTPDLPYPPHQGAAIRTYNLIKNLAPDHDVHLLSFLQGGDEGQRMEALSPYCASVVTVPAPSRSAGRRALSVLLSSRPDMALRLPSAEFNNRLRILLSRERFDFVQVEAIEMAQYGLAAQDMRASSPQPLVVFDDINAEYLLQRRAFETDVRHPRRWLGAAYSLVQWRKLQRYERRVCQRLDRIVVVSEADATALQRLVPGLHCFVVPNGVDTSYFQPTSPSAESDTTLVYTGKMDFRPNVDAVLWFVEDVLPLVRQQVPEVTFKIVGRNPHLRLRALGEAPNVTLTGYVSDVRPYVEEAAVYVVPLRVGGGTRLKVMEAMSMGKAIVSTSLGCEGIGVSHGRELLIADDAGSFAQAVVSLMKDRDRRRTLQVAARDTAEREHDWTQITPLLERVYES
jgi:sugar transferase (PEP-CTERM/EpsH1 system associated)